MLLFAVSGCVLCVARRRSLCVVCCGVWCVVVDCSLHVAIRCCLVLRDYCCLVFKWLFNDLCRLLFNVVRHMFLVRGLVCVVCCSFLMFFCWRLSVVV